jgi:hypothetical protein
MDGRSTDTDLIGFKLVPTGRVRAARLPTVRGDAAQALLRNHVVASLDFSGRNRSGAVATSSVLSQKFDYSQAALHSDWLRCSSRALRPRRSPTARDGVV